MTTPRIRIILLSVLIGGVGSLAAAAQTFTYGDVDVDLGYEVAATSDGGFAAVGFTSEGNWIDGFVVRADADGAVLWQREPSLSDLSERFYDVVPTDDGGLVLIGSVDLPGASDNRPWILKLDAAGDEVWSTADDLTLELEVDSGIVRGVELTNGDLAIMGGSNGYTDTQDPWLLVLSPDGHLRSFEVFPTLGPAGFGVATYVNDLAATADGGFAATGYVSGGTGFGYLWRFDAHGTPLWDRLYIDAGFRVGEAVLATDDGFLAVGCDAPNCANTAVLRVDAHGDVDWISIFSDAGGDYTLGRDAILRADDSLVVAQTRTSAIGGRFPATDLLSVDAAGHLIETTPLVAGTTSTAIYRLTATGDDGELLAVGTANDTEDPSAVDLVVIRTERPADSLLHGDHFESGTMGGWSGVHLP